MVRVPLLSSVVTLVRSGKSLPSNRATFRIAPSMGKMQLKAYLKQLYGLDVVSVNTLNRLGAMKRSPYTTRVARYYKRPDFKLAYVTFRTPIDNPLQN